MKHFEEIHLLHLYSQAFHVPILWALLSYSRFCLYLSPRRLLRRVSKHQLLSKSLIQHFWKQPLANVLTSTQTPRLRSTRRLVTLCHHLPSKQKHATRHYRNMVASFRNSHRHMNIYEFCMISFLSSFWLKKTYACEVGLINVSKTQPLLLNSSMMMSILPLARERVDESSNAPTNVPMSHIHHATIAVIHNRNPVWCWLSQASIQHAITSSNF